MVNNAQKFIEKAITSPDAELDAADVATAKTDQAEIIERAKALARSEREKLKREIEEAHTGAADADKEALQGIMSGIDAINMAEFAALGAQRPTVEIPSSIAGFELPAWASQAKDMITNLFGSMTSGTLFGLATFAEGLGITSVSAWIRGFAEPGAIREAMQRRLNAKIVKTPDDAGHAKTLRAQYQAKLDADKKDPAVYGFETFYMQKIEQLSRTPKASYTLADLTNIESVEKSVTDEKKAAEIAEETEKKKETDKKNDIQKQLKGSPEERKKAYLETFRDALNSVAPDSVPVTAGDTPQKIAQKIASAFSEHGDTGLNNFGLETNSGGDLEEADGNSWFTVDYNILDLWEDKLLNNPVGAINAFLAIDPSKWESTNPVAAQTIQKVRDYMAAKGITPASIGSAAAADAPTEEPTETDA